MNICVILVFSCPVSIHCIISAAQTTISLKYITFSLKSNKLPTFFETTQVYQYLPLCFYGQMSSPTDFQLPKTF